MAKRKDRTLEEAGGMELLRALGGLVVKGAKEFPGQVAAKAHELVSAGGGKIDAAICAAVRKHLDECAPCRSHAAKAIGKAAGKTALAGKAKPAKAAAQPTKRIRRRGR